MCKNAKKCQNGENCDYAHTENEIKIKQLEEKDKTFPGYKNNLCKHFKKNGYCKFGKNCLFAHGEQDLCNPYYKVLFCTKMPNCTFGEFCNNGDTVVEIRPYHPGNNLDGSGATC